MSLLLFDALLCLLLLALALASMLSRQLTHAVILYVAFGLLMALAWARLAAPDLALAEAAIGAGLTGALCFTALARQGAPAAALKLSWQQRLWPALFVLLMLTGLLQALLQVPASAGPIPEMVMLNLADSGVTHPVTAVLLNFRSWDTLLELLVLLLALLGTLQIAPVPTQQTSWRLSRSWSELLAPLIILLAGYVLWAGASQPGGAFQAGALLAAGAVVLKLNQQLSWLGWQNIWIRLVVVAGLAVFSLVAVLAWLLPVPGVNVVWLRWPPDYAKYIILLIEVFATLSIALTLTLLVVSEQPATQLSLARENETGAGND
ncbi:MULTISPECIES: hydrogenase subunit MbhD domain-containing protein [unclassified Arsukibacterium]|uniref:hydrogenase subunit MbhD domain-containing protein n=1 Tax=unclassified Arsukibacterium TaxID=2635278 RepID=UPI000C69BB70|nr:MULTISPECIES: hydrogenase subunit MbhD domain-containing protein [unclassified Arsukibacterium]MAA96213.1 sodium:proton antiporter [Rheinheimera sp.]MBM35040.1 sodium:proton antiporter [Rheinheimera sp.]HAW92408.1 sodium:proton antiporter [Candidatus Azambacteria bacterium]|tara:strand:- start:12748 stop:13707 length:960 start_codon:yes stop_codon:yes gene_type:complete